MVVRNGLDWFHLVMDVAKRVLAAGPHDPHVYQAMRERLVQHRHSMARHGWNLPEAQHAPTSRLKKI